MVTHYLGLSAPIFFETKMACHSAPIPNPRRLRGLREEAEWGSLIRNFWGLGNRHVSFFQPHFGRHIALGESALLRALRGGSSIMLNLMLSHALSMLYPCSIHALPVSSVRFRRPFPPPVSAAHALPIARLCLGYKAIQKNVA